MGCSTSKEPSWLGKHFQVKINGEWWDFASQQDVTVTRSFLAGDETCYFSAGNALYEADFTRMVRRDIEDGRECKIRPPRGMKRPRRQACQPTGPPKAAAVQEPQRGETMQVHEPCHLGEKSTDRLPDMAKEPQRGETMQVDEPCHLGEKSTDRLPDMAKAEPEGKAIAGTSSKASTAADSEAPPHQVLVEDWTVSL